MEKYSELLEQSSECMYGLIPKLRRMIALRESLHETQPGITDKQFLVLDTLKNLGKKTLTMRDMSKSTGISPSHLTKVVKELVTNLKYVIRETNPEDWRKASISLTPDGIAVHSDFLKARVGHFRAIFDRFSEEDLRLMMRIIDLLDNTISAMLKELQSSS